LYYVEFKTLKEISKELGIKHFTVQRLIHSSKETLEKEIGSRPELKECLNAFDDIPYLNIKSINRGKKDARKLYKIQIGENTLGEWVSKDSTPE
jgi:DNA-binding transcriptional regulator LsrR (DeoR family)